MRDSASRFCVPDDNRTFGSRRKRHSAGRTVGAGDLPPRQGRVGRAVLALLAGDRDTAREQLAAAEREPDPAVGGPRIPRSPPESTPSSSGTSGSGGGLLPLPDSGP
ncbi:hypothetical protein [Rhodococcus opacus]|uniref:hypothetical protein n=1 Tax=Rhodococcus opacus TaxID=37919 RepID=UPI0034D18C85